MAYDSNLRRLPDPNTVPVGPGWISQGLTDVVPGMTHPLNGPAFVTVQQGGQYWQIDISYPELLLEEAQELLAFRSYIKGSFTPFYIQLPGYDNPKTGQWSILTSVERGAGLLSMGNKDQVVISDKSLLGGSFSLNDFLKLTNSNKIYSISYIEDGPGNQQTLTLNCDIQGTVDGTTEFEPNDVKFRVKSMSGMGPTTINTSGIVPALSFRLREDI